VQSPPVWWVVAYYVLLALVLSRLPRLFKRMAVSAAAVVVGAGVAFMVWPKDVVEITALDLPDGMAVFVNAPGERHDWLIDGGGDWSGERVVVPYLRGQGVDRLEAILLTRGDKAHAGGLSGVVEIIPTGRALHSGAGSRSKFFWDWLGRMRQQHLPIGTIRAGDDVMITGDIRLQVLNPPPESSYTRSDDNSVVLLLEFGSNRVLLTSDAGASVERRLLANHADLRAQVIVKGRHADETSCIDEFLDAVRPEAVVQCVNSRPSDRYLQPELRDRLRQRGIAYYRTDEAGAVTIRLAPNGYTIYTWR